MKKLVIALLVAIIFSFVFTTHVHAKRCMLKIGIDGETYCERGRGRNK